MRSLFVYQGDRHFDISNCNAFCQRSTLEVSAASAVVNPKSVKWCEGEVSPAFHL